MGLIADVPSTLAPAPVESDRSGRLGESPGRWEAGRDYPPTASTVAGAGPPLQSVSSGVRSEHSERECAGGSDLEDCFNERERRAVEGAPLDQRISVGRSSTGQPCSIASHRRRQFCRRFERQRQQFGSPPPSAQSIPSARASSLRRPVRVERGHRVALAVPHAVDLVEDEELRRLHADVLQHSADGLDTPLAVGCRSDNDVEEQRRVGQLLEGGAKGGDECSRSSQS